MATRLERPITMLTYTENDNHGKKGRGGCTVAFRLYFATCKELFRIYMSTSVALHVVPASGANLSFRNPIFTPCFRLDKTKNRRSRSWKDGARKKGQEKHAKVQGGV